MHGKLSIILCTLTDDHGQGLRNYREHKVRMGGWLNDLVDRELVLQSHRICFKGMLVWHEF
jgi:hypothetical protein